MENFDIWEQSAIIYTDAQFNDFFFLTIEAVHYFVVLVYFFPTSSRPHFRWKSIIMFSLEVPSARSISFRMLRSVVCLFVLYTRKNVYSINQLHNETSLGYY